MKMNDLLRDAEEVHFHQATVISIEDVKKKVGEFNKLTEQVEKMGHENQRKIRQTIIYKMIPMFLIVKDFKSYCSGWRMIRRIHI